MLEYSELLYYTSSLVTTAGPSGQNPGKFCACKLLDMFHNAPQLSLIFSPLLERVF